MTRNLKDADRDTIYSGDEEQQHEHDQLPTVDEILVERGQGKILSSSTTTTASSATPNRNIWGEMCTCRGIICIFLVLVVVAAIVIVSIVAFPTASVTLNTATNNTTVYTEEENENENLGPAKEIENLGPATLATISTPSTPGVALHYNITQNDLIEQGLALFGGTEFDDKKSHQSRALEVLIENGVPIHDNNFNDNDQRFGISDRQKLAQRYALLCLYFSTNSVRTSVSDEAFGYGTTPKWHNKDVPSPWKFNWKADECDWAGVVCENNSSNSNNNNNIDNKLITRIELVNHLLTGYLPMELKLLNAGPIEVLDFSNNRGLGEGGFPSVFSEFDSLGKLSYLCLFSIIVSFPFKNAIWCSTCYNIHDRKRSQISRMPLHSSTPPNPTQLFFI